MKKSDDEQQEPELPTLDYSNLPPEIEEVVSQQRFEIKKTTKLTWDGKQFSMRIPTEIAGEAGITKETRAFFHLIKPLPGSTEKVKLEISLV
ncbi:hypothetical protein JW979_12190 [bacterium]|nr:hypothetical protein [candidate division CSSED10-310 bacterium]